MTLLAKQLSGRNNHRKVAYGTEGGLFAQAGIPTVVIGPGSIDQAHKADEFIAVSELNAWGEFIIFGSSPTAGRDGRRPAQRSPVTTARKPAKSEILLRVPARFFGAGR